MAKRREWSPGIRPGRQHSHTFDRLVSPLGADCGQTPEYSPAREVKTRQPKGRGNAGSEYARNERRG
jgi:hypothetical protein